MSLAPEIQASRSPSASWTSSRGASPVLGVGACRVLECGADGAVVEIEQRFEPANPYLIAHFPTFRIYPGVFVLETVRQGLTALAGAPSPVRVIEVRSMRFRAPMLAGDRLIVRAELEPAAPADGASPRHDGAARRHDGGAWRVRAHCRLADGSEAARLVLTVTGIAAPQEWPGAAPQEWPGGFDA